VLDIPLHLTCGSKFAKETNYDLVAEKKLFHAYISWLLKSSSGAQVPLWATKIVTEK
jgi:hypothetical protein